jgi:Fe-S cluster assembly scaffold protein SufB
MAKREIEQQDDPELRQYSAATTEHPYLDKLSEMPPEDAVKLAQAGMDVSAESRSGSFLQVDQSVVHAGVSRDNAEVLSTEEGLARYDWATDYLWNAVSAEADKYTLLASLQPHHGYFIRSLPGTQSTFPVQACLFVKTDNLLQHVHNIIIAEEGSELEIISGCATAPHLSRALHVGISEFYVKKGATLTFTMIHNWAEEVGVRPRSAAIVEEGGTFVSNYICLKPVQLLQMYPTARLVGKGAVARFSSMLLAHPGAKMDVGSRAILAAPETRAEVVSRAVSAGGEIIARGHLRAEAPGVRAHLECRGLILTETGLVHAIPELETTVRDVDLSHEAAVGKIAQDEIEYLMSRGLPAHEATAAIVRGFLDVGIAGLPAELQDELDKAIALSESEGM